MHGPTCIVWANLTPFSLQLATAMDRCSEVRWQRLRMGNRLRGQEGHSAALLGGRWMVVVGGFGGAPHAIWDLDCC